MLGIDRLGYWAQQYGFGAPTGSTCPARSPGIVPTNQWKQDALGAQIYPGETYQAGIGQGYDVVTPIQLINAYAALANGGTLYQPQIVREIVGPDGTVVRPFKPKLIHKIDVRPSVLKTMRNAARSAVTRAPHLQPRRPADQGRRQVRHRRVRHARQQGPAAVPLLVRRVRAEGPAPRRPSTGTDVAARRPRLRLRLADQGQRRDRDRQVLPPAPLRIKKDYRLPNLLKRGNFYQSN